MKTSLCKFDFLIMNTLYVPYIEINFRQLEGASMSKMKPYSQTHFNSKMVPMFLPDMQPDELIAIKGFV